MLKLSHSTLVLISGLMWLAIGCFLLPLGLKLLIGSGSEAMLGNTESHPLINFITPYLGNAQQASLLLIVLGLVIGRFKGKKILSKSVQRNIARIQTFPNPTSVTNIYGWGYLVLIAVMIGLGVSIRYFGVPSDIRGLIDVAVGAALIQGAIAFFYASQAIKKNALLQK